MKPLILASTSPYRRELLGRLGVPFLVAEPEYEESASGGLPLRDLALCHALGKARSLRERFPERWIIGSDQVAELDGAILGKPGSRDAAVGQLARMSGRRVAFHTGVAVVGAGRELGHVEDYWALLRTLSPQEIAAYVERDRPFHSAGSFRIESLGIALMEAMEGRDYTALIGLPLIALTRLLSECGVEVLTALSSSDTSA